MSSVGYLKTVALDSIERQGNVAAPNRSTPDCPNMCTFNSPWACAVHADRIPRETLRQRGGD